MMKSILLSSLAVATVCLMATPAMASLNHFGFGPVTMTYDGAGTFTANQINTKTVGIVNDSGLAIFGPGITPTPPYTPIPWDTGGDLSAFTLSLAISGQTATSAAGTGTFAITDKDGDTLTGTVSGLWTKIGTTINFDAQLGNVKFTDTGTQDGQFNGNISGFVVMDTTVRTGSINVGPLTTDDWFTSITPWTLDNGSVDASIVVPVPVALLLGFLGLGTAGVGLRRLA